MQRAIPLEGLPVGRTWRQSFTVEEMQSSSLEVSVHLCHVQQQVKSEQNWLSMPDKESNCKSKSGVYGRQHTAGMLIVLICRAHQRGIVRQPC